MVLHFFILIGVVWTMTTATVLDSSLNDKDIKALRSVFESALSEKNLMSLHYGSAGLRLIGEKINEAAKICEEAKKLIKEQDIESLYYAAGLVDALGDSCKVSLTKTQGTVLAVIDDAKSTAQSLYYGIFVAKKLKLSIENGKMSNALLEALKRDNAAASLSYIFHSAALLDGPPAEQIYAKIEDCVAQADEINKKYLQFEGGLSATAVAVSSIYTLSQKATKAPAVKPEEAVKFANFLLSRKGINVVRPAYHLLHALMLMANNQFQIPIAINRISPISVSTKQPNLKVSVTDVMGKTLGALTVLAESASQTATKTTLYTKKQFKADASNNHEINFMEAKPAAGFYTLVLSAASATDKRLVGNTNVEMTVKVITELNVEDVQLAVLDRDQTVFESVLKRLASYSKLPNTLDADVHQKFAMRFMVKDKSANAPMKIHQAFVLFTHLETEREIVFIAECNQAKTYSVDIDFHKSAKDFDYQSGKYAVKLILGDFVTNSPIFWHFADIKLNLPSQAKQPSSGVEHIVFHKKPEITHVFRPADKRPPNFVSDTFTALCFVPLLLLFVIWLRIGINFSNFRFDLYTVGFHAGLAAIFGLYFVFWLRLNMFQTLKYLAAISCFTFLAGHRMLKSMAERRKSKTD